jgi:hypothetical protein
VGTGKNTAIRRQLKEYFSLVAHKNTKPFQQELPRAHYLIATGRKGNGNAPNR